MRIANMMRISLMAMGLALLPLAASVQGVPEAAAQQDDKDREAEKEARKAAREAEKEAKRAEKEAKKAEREAQKAAREAEKAARKQAEDAEKAAKKAEKEAEKAARRDGKKNRHEAKELSRRGLEHFSNGEFDQAIECFTKAYELDPLPEHQFNLGWAYKRKGDKRNAYGSFQKFLAANPRDASMVAEATEYSDELKRYIDAEDAILAENKQLQERVKQAEQQAEQAGKERDEARRLAGGVKGASPEGTPVQAKRGLQTGSASGTGAGGGKRTAGAVMLAAGGVALGAAIFSGLEARSADRKLDGLGADDTFTESRVWLHDRGEAAEKRMIIFSITGAALVAGGAVVYYLGERQARRPSPTERGPVAITPALSPSSAGIQVSGSF